MANNLENRDGLIVIGVTNDYKVTGTFESDKNRKTTQQLNDFLKSKSFVGNIRPMVRVERVVCEAGKKVDVIVIENSKNTPFILAKDYTDKPPSAKPITIRGGNIYTRVQDTNTAIDATADNDKTEALWRKRFRIDETPYEKLRYYLQDINGWKKSGQTNNYSFYYQYAPEYSINLEPYGDDYESHMFDYLCKICIANIDRPAKYRPVHFKVFDQVIWEHYYVWLDDGRYETIMPNFDSIIIDGAKRRYLFLTYLCKDSIEFLFYKFLRGRDRQSWQNYTYQERDWLSCVLFFENKQEKNAFVRHIKNNTERLWEEYERTENRRKPSTESCNDWSNEDNQDWRSAIVLKKEYSKWRENAT